MSTDSTLPDRRSTRFLDRALVLADVVVWRTDLSTQRIHLNAVGFKILGLEPTPDGIGLLEMRGSMTHPDDVALVERANQQAQDSQEVVDQVARYRVADGSWRHQLTRRVAERDAQGQVLGFSGIAMDVTELLLERQAVQRLHEHTSLAAQVLGVGFWSHQPDSEGRYTVQGDDQMHRIYGCEPGLPAQEPLDVDQWLSRFVHPEDRAWVAQRMHQANQDQQSLVDICYRIINCQGQTRWVHSWSHRMLQNGKLVVFGMELDVTESQRAQHQRQREQQREQFAVEAAAVGIWERDLQGHVEYWNETMYRQRGCTSDDPRHPDQIMADTTHPADRATLVSAYGQHLASGEPYREELRLCLADGTQRWILAHGRPLRDTAGQVVGMAGINLDITAQKTAALLSQEKQRAEQTSRDKSAFMARMSHELRTPMNAVLGFSQLMRDDAAHPLPAAQLLRLNLIEDAGQQLLKLIDNLLEISQRADAEPPPAANGSLQPEPPASPPPSPPAPAPTSPAAADTAAVAGLHVLCVEDNPVNLLLVQEVLTLRPHVRLRCAETGLAGVAAALEEAPDVLLLDLQLPDISGHEVFQRLHALPQMAACRFIALSADAMPESIEASLAAGFHDYWTKPIQFDRFLAQMDHMVQQRSASGG